MKISSSIPSLPGSTAQPMWLLTFSDLITLLLTFFVLRYAIAIGNNLKTASNFKENNSAIITIDPFQIINNIDNNDLPALIPEQIQKNSHFLLAIDSAGFVSGTETLTFEATVAIKSLAKVLTQKNLAAKIVGISYTSLDETDFHYSQWDLAGARTMAIYRQLVDAKVSPYALSLGSKVIDNKNNSPQITKSDLVRIVIYKP